MYQYYIGEMKQYAHENQIPRHKQVIKFTCTSKPSNRREGGSKTYTVHSNTLSSVYHDPPLSKRNCRLVCTPSFELSRRVQTLVTYNFHVGGVKVVIDKQGFNGKIEGDFGDLKFL